MTTLQFVLLATVAGLPGAFVQAYMYFLERRRQRKSLLWQAWAALQTELSQTLHHPHPEAREMDSLLEKLETFTLAGVSAISHADRVRLTKLLREKVDDPNQEKEERIRAEFLLFAMPRARR